MCIRSTWNDFQLTHVSIIAENADSVHHGDPGINILTSFDPTTTTACTPNSEKHGASSYKMRDNPLQIGGGEEIPQDDSQARNHSWLYQDVKGKLCPASIKRN